jgi:hypothetical protein
VSLNSEIWIGSSQITQRGQERRGTSDSKPRCQNRLDKGFGGVRIRRKLFDMRDESLGCGYGCLHRRFNIVCRGVAVHVAFLVSSILVQAAFCTARRSYPDKSSLTWATVRGNTELLKSSLPQSFTISAKILVASKWCVPK